MTTRTPSGYYDPRNGDPAIRIDAVKLQGRHAEPPRTNYFSIYFIEQGAGTFWADAARHAYRAPSLLFFVPYQHLRFRPLRASRGRRVRFHANFLCVETFHAQVGCSGVLFNDPYGSPLVELDEPAAAEVAQLFDRLDHEQAARRLAYEEALVSYLKVLLIMATRRKEGSACAPGFDPRHPVLGPLRELIEANYCRLHAPSEYAALLHMTPKTLGRIVREQLGLTLTVLIRRRILTHAKWQLLHTLRPVKEIAREVGFQDELYFSRMFRKATGLSPRRFRQFETEIRGGSNLSMFSGDTSLQPSGKRPDNSVDALADSRRRRTRPASPR